MAPAATQRSTRARSASASRSVGASALCARKKKKHVWELAELGKRQLSNGQQQHKRKKKRTPSTIAIPQITAPARRVGHCAEHGSDRVAAPVGDPGGDEVVARRRAANLGALVDVFGDQLAHLAHTDLVAAVADARRHPARVAGCGVKPFVNINFVFQKIQEKKKKKTKQKKHKKKQKHTNFSSVAPAADEQC
jgi:hypothetical protein